MTNALVGTYNIGVAWLSSKVGERISEFYRDRDICHIFESMSGIGPRVIADRYHERKFVFNHDCSWLPDVKYEYKKVGTFEEVFII